MPPERRPKIRARGSQFECSMTGQKRGKFESNELWPELH
jgi:hypothetical protein